VKKVILSSLIATSIVFTNPVRADQPPTPTPQENVQVESMDTAVEEDPLPTGSEVSPSEPDGPRRDASRRRWRNIALAVAAVALSITAIVLASTNRGHRKS
jgi:hypothetical protein